jgi:hypothetical protein
MEGDVARPVLSVITVGEPLNATLGPLLSGGINVTTAPGTRLPNMSWTAALSGAGYTVPVIAVCPIPEIAVMLVADAGVISNELLAPEIEAVEAASR